tara:strand:- start:955 stop:1113 length:159 start_codon:yes stop_codon:yes gene_type:complete
MTRDYSKDIVQHGDLLVIPVTRENMNDMKNVWAALDAAPRPASWPDNNKEEN